jgi:hypothetical protein
MRRIWTTVAAAAALSSGALVGGCATTYPGEPASAHDAERIDETSSQDMFILRVDVGRVGVFNDRIATVLGVMPDPPEPEAVASVEASERARAAYELKDAAASIRSVTLDFLKLEGEACAKGKFADISCKNEPLPAWLGDRSDKPVSAIEVQNRLNWLQERMSPLLDVVCEKGKTLVREDEGGGEMFCSVE